MNHTGGTVPDDYYAWLGELSRLRQAGRAEAGIYTGKPLNGYVKIGGSEVHAVDEGKRTKLGKVWSLAAGGMPLRGLLEVCRHMGLTSSSRGELSLNSLHLMLTNPFYAGMVRAGSGLVPGRHEALVSKASFDTVQRNLHARRKIS